nr:MAG TPA: hypothetical protein [Caudoviricetes sp.]
MIMVDPELRPVPSIQLGQVRQQHYPRNRLYRLQRTYLKHFWQTTIIS